MPEQTGEKQNITAKNYLGCSPFLSSSKIIQLTAPSSVTGKDSN